LTPPGWERAAARLVRLRLTVRPALVLDDSIPIGERRTVVTP